MAKRRAVTKTKTNIKTNGSRSTLATEGGRGAVAAANDSTASSFRWPLLALAAAALLAALLVIATHWPADSVEVERGAAVYHCGLALVAAALAWLAVPLATASAGSASLSGGKQSTAWGIDLAAWSLAAWIALSSWALSGSVELRMAVNECWVWVAAAASFTAARRLLGSPLSRRTVALLVVLSAVLLAAHGWHQLLVSLPADRARYAAEPEVVLAEAGVDAPPGSAQRMIFENRLADGGPTATFALTNSLAGLLVPAWLLAAGIWLSQWRRLSLAPRCGWGVVVFLIGSLLLRTNSRSAVAAVVLVSIAWLLFAALRDGGAVRRRMDRRSWRRLVGIALLVAVGLAGYVATNREISERAWASLSVRGQYWRSTAAMVADSPWFGCGPGNFQAAYEAFRDIDASEQPADPHNLVMETAAAGGIPAALLLVLLAGLGVQRLRELSKRQRSGSEARDDDATGGLAPANVAGALGVGYVGGWLVVWMLGLLIAQAPDIGAHLWAVPIAIGSTFLIGRWWQAGDLPRWVLVGAVAGLLLHLMMSGGWTIPGVAVPLWLLAGAMLADDPRSSVASAGRPTAAVSGLRWGIGILAALILGAFFWTELRPVSEASRWMMQAAVARQDGAIDQVAQAYRRAAAADPWDSSPSAALADLYRHVLLQQDTPELRQGLDAAGQAARQASPSDPSLLAFLGELRLHLFQRWGDEDDLRVALELYQQAAARAPANERLAAQLALIYQALGDEQAADWADRARQLAAAGGHIERALQRVTILPVKVVGEAAAKRPQQGTADKWLPNRKPAETVSSG